jgi:hypothetical protein
LLHCGVKFDAFDLFALPDSRIRTGPKAFGRRDGVRELTLGSSLGLDARTPWHVDRERRGVFQVFALGAAIATGPRMTPRPASPLVLPATLAFVVLSGVAAFGACSKDSNSGTGGSASGTGGTGGSVTVITSSDGGSGGIGGSGGSETSGTAGGGTGGTAGAPSTGPGFGGMFG